jgi:predicted transposase YbfD/YdcC
VESAEYLRETLSFPGLKVVARLEREVKEGGKIILQDDRYFACSLDPVMFTPKTLMKWLRGHWQIENSLHFIKDRWWDEDRHWSCRPGLAERLAGLLNAALTVLRLPGIFDEKLPIRARADHLCWAPVKALRLLGAM